MIPVEAEAATVRWDWQALRAGAGVALVFAVPFSVAARWVADNDSESGLPVVLSLGAIIGFVLGAGVAAWSQRPGFPLAHGLVTALATYLAAQAAFIVVRLLLGGEVHWYAALFNVAPVLFAGLVGGFLGQALQRRGVMPRSLDRDR